MSKMENLKKLEPFSVAVIAYFMLLIMSFLTVVSFYSVFGWCTVVV